MTVEQEPLVAGLHTTHHPIASVPLGALVRAENTVLRRAGMLEAHPGFKRQEELPNSNLVTRFWERNDGSSEQAIAHTQEPKTFASDDGEDPWVEIDTTSGSTSGDGFAVSDVFRAVRNEYYVTDRGVYRHSKDADPVYAGLPKSLLLLILPTLGTAIGDGQVAYRMTWAFTDAQGVLHESEPSGRAVLDNTAGAPTGVNIIFYVPPGITTGHRYRIYRTVLSAVSPGDRMYLIEERAPLASEIATGITNYVDYASTDANLGVPLYTNDTADGIQQAAARPPVARNENGSAVFFNDHAFYANASQPQRMDLRIVRQSDVSGGMDEQRIKAGFTWGVGSSVLTGNISALDGLSPGQYLDDSAGEIPDDARIVSFVYGAPGTITMDKVTTGASGGTVTIYDHITVDGLAFRFATADSASLVYPGPTINAFDTPAPEVLARRIVHVITDVAIGGGLRVLAEYTGTMTVLANTDDGSFALYRVHEGHPDVGEFDVEFSAGFGYNAGTPDLTKYPFDVAGQRDGDTATSESLGGPSHIFISKAGQPESVPVLNFITVGDAAKQILRMAVVRESIFVFKEDGIFRITGFSVGSFRVDDFSPQSRLVARETVARLGDRIYALAENGVVTITDGGVMASPPVSWPIDDRIAAAIQEFKDVPDVACFAYARERESEYVIWVPNSNDNAEHVSSHAYVFNETTRAWTEKTEWKASAGFAFGPSGKTFLGDGESAYVLVSRVAEIPEKRLHSSLEFNENVATFTLNDEYAPGLFADRVTLSAHAGQPTVTVGDVLARSSSKTIVVAVTSDTDFWVDNLAAIGAGIGPAVLAHGIACTVEPRVKTMGAVPALKHFQEVSVPFENFEGIQTASMTYQAERQSPQTVTRRFERLTTEARRELRWFVPRNHGLSVFLKVTLRIRQACSPWTLWGFNVMGEPLSEVVERG